MSTSVADLEREVVEHLRALVAIDTSNPGSTEAVAARYVADALTSVGVGVEVVEAAPGRCSVIARQPGVDRALPALVVHGHLDVVPADPATWSHDPFSAEIDDGCVWGRGTVDMKAMVAMMLTAQRAFAGAATPPRRELVFAYFADEEAGGGVGSRWLVEHRPELFERATEAIGEVGGFTMTLPDGRRVYPLQTAERGMLWARIGVQGPGGHAAFSTVDNPLLRVARLIERIERLAPPPAEPEETLVERLGPAALGAFGAMAARGEQTSYTVTAVAGGSKPNMIPEQAHVTVDCRFPAGAGPAALAALRSALDADMSLEILTETPGARAPREGRLLDIAAAALARADPDGVVVPYAFAGGTDGQQLARLGIAPYGFAPLILDGGFDVAELFHARDERVPVAAVQRGLHVLIEFLTRY